VSRTSTAHRREPWLPPVDVESSSRSAQVTEANARRWIHFCRHLSSAWIYLRRHCPAIRAIERGPLTLLRAVADHWQGHEEAYPGQEWLADLTGYDVRSVRDFATTLVTAALVHVRRERQRDGTERIYYAPGPALLTAVDDFSRRHPDDRAKPLRGLPRAPACPLDPEALRAVGEQLRATQRELAQARKRIAELESERVRHAYPPETVSAGPPEAIAGELSDLEDHREPSSSCAQSFARTAANK